MLQALNLIKNYKTFLINQLFKEKDFYLSMHNDHNRGSVSFSLSDKEILLLKKTYRNVT